MLQFVTSPSVGVEKLHMVYCVFQLGLIEFDFRQGFGGHWLHCFWLCRESKIAVLLWIAGWPHLHLCSGVQVSVCVCAFGNVCCESFG